MTSLVIPSNNGLVLLSQIKSILTTQTPARSASQGNETNYDEIKSNTSNFISIFICLFFKNEISSISKRRFFILFNNHSLYAG